ncbi:DUF1697 domain-containing protein [Cognaticolwellia beringensis]|uniref:DUF1697 domain-containing protein n=1 Tax=Cognaticolwellia beringensis TaxID=1967665 RepID=A0A222GAI3_9GAMM|nr:DUF1697 domain-containing protein [Cognaticolwellia beringensis]ASP48801.1 DUF1697 domain-containing protein [Cognaticolwellia beringensis]
MTTYISLLRGINVAGQKIIKMADLRALYQQLSFENVKSYIQSGNVVFNHNEGGVSYCSQLAKQIHLAIFVHYQFEVPVFVLTPFDLQTARENLPFKNIDLSAEGSKVLLCFLSDVPSNSTALLSPYLKENEHLQIIDKVLYLHCEDGYGRSKLTHTIIEKKLNVNATSRNLKTVDKLITLAATNIN